MIIRQTNMNLVYPRISEYRKKFLNLEDVLENHFMPSTILPIPEQVQDEVPRIIVQSKNGHERTVNSRIDSARELFDGNMREFTEEETEKYEESLEKISKPIGVKIFD